MMETLEKLAAISGIGHSALMAVETWGRGDLWRFVLR